MIISWIFWTSYNLFYWISYFIFQFRMNDLIIDLAWKLICFAKRYFWKWWYAFYFYVNIIENINFFILYMPQYCNVFNTWDDIDISNGEPRAPPTTVEVSTFQPSKRNRGWSNAWSYPYKMCGKNLIGSGEDALHRCWVTMHHHRCELKPLPRRDWTSFFFFTM